MTVTQLQREYRKLFPERRSSSNKERLVKELAWKIQADLEGDFSKETESKLRAYEKTIHIPDSGAKNSSLTCLEKASSHPLAPTKRRDPRLPAPGTLLTRVYQGQTFEVMVMEEGFEYGGKMYASLSHIARFITKTRWNGYLFFSLSNRKRTE